MQFENEQAFKAWLEDQSREVCVAIATRAALRVRPVLLTDRFWKDSKKVRAAREKLALLTGWSNLIAGVTSTCPTHAIRSAADAAARAAADAAAADDDAADAAIAAARAAYAAARAAYAAAHAHAPDAVYAYCYAYDADAAACDAAIAAAYADCGKSVEEMFAAPLWHDAKPPTALSREPLGPSIFDSDPRFEFFCRWYDGMEKGQPLDWELQSRVALIDKEVWKAGADAVAEAIAEIEAEFLAERSPIAETVEVNPDTGNFRAVPIPVENPPLTQTLISRVHDALEDAVQGHNGLNERSGVVRLLTRTCTRYANDPQRVEMDFTDAVVSLRRQMDESFDLPKSEDNLLLLGAVEEGVRGIRQNHPEVAANREVLAGAKLQEVAEEAREVLEAAAPVLVALSEEVMAEDFAADIPELLNTSVGPLPRGAPPLPGAVRTFSRVSKMALLWEKAVAWHDGAPHKLAVLGLSTYGVGKLLYELVKIGLQVFGVL